MVGDRLGFRSFIKDESRWFGASRGEPGRVGLRPAFKFMVFKSCFQINADRIDIPEEFWIFLPFENRNDFISSLISILKLGM